MSNKEADSVIANYKQHMGFFDLSIKPEKLSRMEYAKILEAQNELFWQNERREYLKKFNPSQWESLQEFSANLQQLIFRHWGDSVFV